MSSWREKIDNEIISELMHQKKIYESLEYFAKADINGEVAVAKIIPFADFEKLPQYNLIDRFEEKDGLKLGFNDENKLKYIGVEAISYDRLAPYKKSGFLKNISSNRCIIAWVI